MTVKLVPDQLSFADLDPGYDLKLSPGITRDCPEPRLLPATLCWQPRRETWFVFEPLDLFQLQAGGIRIYPSLREYRSDAWQIKSFRNPDAPHFPANSRNRHGQELCSRSGLSSSFQPGLMVKITRLILVGISHFYIHWLPDWINLYLTRREKHSA